RGSARPAPRTSAGPARGGSDPGLTPRNGVVTLSRGRRHTFVTGTSEATATPRSRDTASSAATTGAAPPASGCEAALALAVDDPAAAEVVRGELDAHPVAGVDPDPVAPHLAGRVAERLVAVVEPDAVHPGAERLEHLSLDLDLRLLAGHVASLGVDEGEAGARGGRALRLRDELDVLGLGALAPLGLVELDLRALGERLEAVARDRAEVDEHVLAAGVRGDEAVPLRIVEPLDGSGCHGNTSLHGA